MVYIGEHKTSDCSQKALILCARKLAKQAEVGCLVRFIILGSYCAALADTVP